VTGAIDVGVVASIGIVFDVGSGDRDTSLPLFRRLVNRAIIKILRVTLFCLSLGDRCCEGGLAVIDVANCACITIRTDVWKSSDVLLNIPILT
jgi:hypothetical protein